MMARTYTAGATMDCWHHEIDTAMTEAEVVRNAGEYLLLWAPRTLSAESIGLTRMRIESGDDVERVNERLARSPVRVDRASPGSGHLREIAQYFRHAATRLGELRTIPGRASAARFQPSV
jgi:hypothetical protein